MAIYQFYLATIPRKGIISYYGKIPNKLEVDFRKRTENLLNQEDEFDYFEFIQHKCWAIAKVDSKQIINQIDQTLDRANRGNDRESNNWKTETTEVDNDAWILTNPEQTQIKEFTFQADLREVKLKFLMQMIELSKEKELLLIDRKGNLIEPIIEKVFELIQQSNAIKFIKNPNEFLTDLEQGENEVE
jgi:hypothetical protein